MSARECGEQFVGWAPRGQWNLDWSFPRTCDRPEGHEGSHDWLEGHERWVNYAPNKRTRRKPTTTTDRPEETP